MLKPITIMNFFGVCLITVQDNTMLKPYNNTIKKLNSLITVQDNTMLKLSNHSSARLTCLITVQDNTMLKRRL